MSAIAPAGDVSSFKAAATYNEAAESYDAAPLSFWARHGAAAVERAIPTLGNRVLDVGCGTGASALLAAESVGSTGEVIGVDAARRMLDRACEKAVERGLSNARFTLGDMAALDFNNAYFERIISVFSIFFLEDMAGHLRNLWRMLAPGGRLVVTTWGRRAFQPCADIFVGEAARFDPSATMSPRPWERLNEAAKLESLFVEAGIRLATVDDVNDRQRLVRPEDWWTVVLGSGYRAIVNSLSTKERPALKAAVLERLSKERIDYFETNVLHAVAEKP